MITNTIELRNFVIEKHGDQKYGKGENERPYIEHIDRVYEESLSHGLSSVISRASLGHDVKEDTDATDEEIIAAFGEEEAAIIFAVSDEPGANRAERKAKTYPKIKATPGATAVKLCDRIANVSDCIETKELGLLEMYTKEQPSFEEALRVPGEYESLWIELERLFTLAKTLAK